MPRAYEFHPLANLFPPMEGGEFDALIEQQFPTLPKIELNRRSPARPGWDAWGNESVPAANAGIRGNGS